jgi:hypothetical protein
LVALAADELCKLEWMIPYLVWLDYLENLVRGIGIAQGTVLWGSQEFVQEVCTTS